MPSAASSSSGNERELARKTSRMICTPVRIFFWIAFHYMSMGACIGALMIVWPAFYKTVDDIPIVSHALHAFKTFAIFIMTHGDAMIGYPLFAMPSAYASNICIPAQDARVAFAFMMITLVMTTLNFFVL